jgi:hypothetical protein
VRLILSLLVPALFAACFLEDERHIGYERDRIVIGPVELKDGVAYVDGARDRVIIVDVTGARPRFHTVGIGRRAIFATPTPDKQHLVVITRGEEAVVEGQVDEEPLLWLIDTTAHDADPLAFEIGSPFDRIAMASDGSVAVTYYSEGGFDAESGVFRNPNELGIVDLGQPPSDDNPVVRTVRSFGSAPDGVVLSPPMAVPGAEDPTPRIFAFILSINTLTMLDATNPERNEVSIRLDGAGGQVRPRELVFAPNTATAYLRSDNARDVLAIFINADPPSAEQPLDNDYRPSLAELGAGGGPSDVAFYDDPLGKRFVLAATPNTREVAVINGDTAEFVTIPTPDAIDRIVLFPNDPDVPARQALLAALNQRVPRVHLLSLDGIDDELVPVDLRTVDLAEPVLDVVPVPGRELAMIIHDDDRTVLGLLDVAFDSVSPLQGVGKLDTYDFSAGGEHLVGATTQAARVGFLELDTLHPSDMRLDDVPAKVFALSGGGIYIDHGDPFGRATYMPHAEATRAESFALSGFLLAELIDEAL